MKYLELLNEVRSINVYEQFINSFAYEMCGSQE